MKTFLIATREDKVPLISKYLGRRFNLIIATSLQDALAGLDADIDLIACNILFGEGHLYDLLKAAKSHAYACKLPFIVVNAELELFSPAIRQSIEIATATLGAAQFVELANLRQQFGDEGAFDRIGDIMEQHAMDPARARS